MRIRHWPASGSSGRICVAGVGVVENDDGATAAQLRPQQRGTLPGSVGYLGGRGGQHPEQAMLRLGRVERRVPGIVGVQVEVERPVRVLPGHRAGRLERQRGLPHPGQALDDTDPRGFTILAGEQFEFLAAAHELRGPGRQRVRPRDPARTGTGGPHRQLGIMAQDALMKLGQQRPRLGALLLDEAAADIPVQAEGLTGPAASVEGRHLVRDERLIQRVLGQQVVKLADQVAVPAQLQLALDALQDGRPAFLLEAVPHPCHPVAANPRERLAVPEPVRLAQQQGRVTGVAGRGRCVGFPAQSAELVQVNRVRVDVELVAAVAPGKADALANGLPE